MTLDIGTNPLTLGTCVCATVVCWRLLTLPLLRIQGELPVQQVHVHHEHDEEGY